MNWNYQFRFHFDPDIRRNSRCSPQLKKRAAQFLPQLMESRRLSLSSAPETSAPPPLTGFTNFDPDTETLVPLSLRSSALPSFSSPTASFGMESRHFSLSSAPETSAPPPLTGSPSSSGPIELQVSCALWLELSGSSELSLRSRF
ncbi:hypothetical protein Bca4012_037332 [Brassica carinata]|uniref:Uncharacterized protein n=1 Tax=Brassica carinata TaxID=52824 RepID=A0A8X7WFH5_BRACI|nr:hypothetical protein Bca52824_011020 [Brassica carinata]